MKRWQTALAILAALSASPALADDFKTINGKEYKNATVSRVEADGIVLKSKSGITKVYFTELPKEVQEQFHSAAQAAAAQAAAAQAAAAQAYAAQQTEQLNKQLRDASAAERKHQTEQQGKQRNIQPVQSQNFITIREITFDQRKFLDQEILLKGTIDVAAYYNWGYSEAQRTHYAFEISDASGSHCYAYMARGENGENLHQQLIRAGRPLDGVFAVMLLSRRYNQKAESQLLVELLNWSGQ